MGGVEVIGRTSGSFTDREIGALLHCRRMNGSLTNLGAHKHVFTLTERRQAIKMWGGFQPGNQSAPSLVRRAGSSRRQSRRVDLHAGGMMAGSRW